MGLDDTERRLKRVGRTTRGGRTLLSTLFTYLALQCRKASNVSGTATNLRSNYSPPGASHIPWDVDPRTGDSARLRDR